MDDNVHGRVEHVLDAPVGIAGTKMQPNRRNADRNPSGPGRHTKSHQRSTAGSKAPIRTAASSSR